MVRVDDGGAARKRAVHHRMDVLRVEALAEQRRADHVEEQNRYQFERLLRGGVGRLLVHEGSQAGAQRREAGIHECVTEQSALSLEPADHRFELFPFRGHQSQA
jgi:hypothetical protein